MYIEGSETQLSFGESSSFATEIHFYCEPVSEPIQPPGHQQGPAQWHGHQVLLSKFNGCVSGEYRIGLDAQRHVIFQREVSPWIVTTTDVIPLHEWHSIVCTTTATSCASTSTAGTPRTSRAARRRPT